jgi:hypothetical protein
MLACLVRASGPDAQITFRVRDDVGNVVKGATVQMNTFQRWVPGPEFGKDIRSRVEGSTDTNGFVVLHLPTLRGSVKYAVSVKGEYFDNTMKMMVAGKAYYRDMGGSFYFTNHVAGKWQPWNPKVELTLKEVLKPIPMYARKYGESYSERERQSIPEYSKAIGFDLMKGDWVAPYGKGETSDFIFTLDCKLGGQTSFRTQIFDATLTLGFSNEGDGIQASCIHPLQGSALRLPRFAPEAGYATNWVKISFMHEDESSYKTSEDENYFFRVRTRRDNSGKIISALYGKIHGTIDYSWNRGIKIVYYLNPTPNDRNLEFDSKRNLFRNLKPMEQVREP